MSAPFNLCDYASATSLTQAMFICVVKLEECHILFWHEFGYSILLCNINLATVLLQVLTSSRSWCSALLSLLRHRPASPPRLDAAGVALDR
jgi:hypothetical protein